MRDRFNDILIGARVAAIAEFISVAVALTAWYGAWCALPK